MFLFDNEDEESLTALLNNGNENDNTYLQVLFTLAGLNILPGNKDLPGFFLLLLIQNVFYLIEVWLFLLSFGFIRVE